MDMLTKPEHGVDLTVALMGLGIGLVISLAIGVVVCLILSSCFARIPREHRKMEPAMVWLLLIPLVNLVWSFFVYPRLSESFQSYFTSAGRADVGDCGWKLGMAYCVCMAVGVVAGLIPCVGGCIALPVSLAGLVLLVIFLVKVSGLKKQISETVVSA